jgi:dipeptidyl aminopeptidase/acylaminoacyl peptidase
MMERDVTLRVDNLKLVGRLYLPEGGWPRPYPTVCVCHGIPLSEEAKTGVGERGYPALAERICQSGFAVLIFNFRGTGASGGNFDLLGWTRDLGAALSFLWTLPEVDHARLALLGFSGGAAVSVCVAAEDRRVAAVVAGACPAEFGSLKSVTDAAEPEATIAHFRRVGIIRDRDFPPSATEWLDSFRVVEPAGSIAKIAPRPLLLVHGGRDEVVDVSHAYRLYAQAGEPKQLVIVNGAGHRLRQDERAMAMVIDWLKAEVG